MKTSTLALIALGGGAALYFATKKSADDNPWRGTNSPCEKAFDKLSPRDKKDLVEFMASSAKAGENSNSEVRKTIATFLGVDALSPCTVAKSASPSSTKI